jgi:selT/selW/selH-like putative selenoprotein
LEQELKSELGVEVECVAGSGGVFEVSVDGRIIFSKKTLKRFPKDGEIISLLKK